MSNYNSTHTGAEIDAAVSSVLEGGTLNTAVASNTSAISSNSSDIAALQDKVTNVENLLGDVVPVIEWLGEGNSFNVSTGALSTSVANRNTTKLIDASLVKTINVNAETPYFYLGYYRADETFVSSHGWLQVGTFNLQADLPSDATQFRIMINTAKCEADDVEIPSALSSLDEALADINTRIDNANAGIDNLDGDMYGTAPAITWVGQGYGMNTATGAVGSGSSTVNRNVTDLIPVSSVTGLSAASGSQYIVGFYDSGGGYLGYDGWLNSTSYSLSNAPVGTASFRLMIDTTKCATTDFTFLGSSTGVLDRLAALEASTGKTEVVVDCNGKGDYTTIEGALASVNDSPTNHVVIKVMPGTYTPAPKDGSTPYNESNRYITLYGVDKNACILEGHVGYYRYQDGVDYSILRLNGNVTIQGFTIKSLSDQYDAAKAAKGWTSNTNKKAYCVHVDATRAAGTTVEIRDCILINDHFTAVGFGLKPDTTLRIVDCYCEMTVGTESEGESYGTLYGHFGGSATSDQRLEIIRCQVVNKSARYAVYLTQGTAGASGSVRLLQNVCKTSATTGAFFAASTYTIDPLSYGNNVESMNYAG